MIGVSMTNNMTSGLSEFSSINKFYDSAAGQKMIEVQPSIMQESMMVGQQWGQKIALEVMNQYKAQ